MSNSLENAFQPWSGDDDRVLLDCLADKWTVKKTAELLDRTEKAVIQRRGKLRRQGVKAAYRPFSRAKRKTGKRVRSDFGTKRSVKPNDHVQISLLPKVSRPVEQVPTISKTDAKAAAKEQPKPLASRDVLVADINRLDHEVAYAYEMLRVQRMATMFTAVIAFAALSAAIVL